MAGRIVPLFLLILATAFSPSTTNALQSCPLSGANTQANNIPPRLQWNNNSGYCGEVFLISAGLYYGQYVSQYDARSAAICGAGQSEGQLLLGLNADYAASLMRLNAIEWNTSGEKSSNDFLAWVKDNVVKGYPVGIGVYLNEFQFYGNPDTNAGDQDYDHIVVATKVGSNHPLSDPNYYGDDLLCFSDHGLWGSDYHPPYHFSYAFDVFQADRKKANARKGQVYSLPNHGINYGLAVTGVMDLNGDTLPVRLDTNLNYEKPVIADGSNKRPKAMPLVLTVTMSNLEPGTPYILYRYNTFESVPDSNFNAHAKDAYQSWPIQINKGSAFIMKLPINSDEIAIFRLVKASAG